jgi:hypothetical protein
MLRKNSVLDILLFTSLFILLFLFVLFANLQLRGLFEDAEHALVREARDRYGLDISFKRLGLASFRSLRFRGLEIRGAQDGLLLASVERLEVGFDRCWTTCPGWFWKSRFSTSVVRTP